MWLLNSYETRTNKNLLSYLLVACCYTSTCISAETGRIPSGTMKYSRPCLSSSVGQSGISWSSWTHQTKRVTSAYYCHKVPLISSLISGKAWGYKAEDKSYTSRLTICPNILNWQAYNLELKGSQQLSSRFVVPGYVIPVKPRGFSYGWETLHPAQVFISSLHVARPHPHIILRGKQVY